MEKNLHLWRQKNLVSKATCTYIIFMGWSKHLAAMTSLFLSLRMSSYTVTIIHITGTIIHITGTMPHVRAEVLSCFSKSGHTWVKLYLAKRWRGGLMEVFWMKLPWNLWILKGTFSFHSLSYCIILDLSVARYWMAIHLAPLSCFPFFIHQILLFFYLFLFIFYFRILFSFSLLSCFWQIFLSHFSHYFSSIGFLLVLSLLYCLFFLYPCFLHSLQAWMPYSAGNLEEPHLLVYIHYGMRHLCLTL